MLLITITWQDVPTHTVTELYQTATIYALPTCSSPQIGPVEKLPCICSDGGYICTWVRCILLTDSHAKAVER